MEYSGARGTLIHDKKLKSKISCQTPFNILLGLRPKTPYPPPLTYCTVYVYKVYLFTQGGGGGSWTREKGRGKQGRVQITKLGWKYQHAECTQEICFLMSKNSDNPMPCREVPLQSFFIWRHFAVTSIFPRRQLSRCVCYIFWIV